MLRGIHINWTKPITAKGKEYAVEDFELMTTVLSALQWKKLYGRIELYTDSVGAAYYEKIGFLPLWDAVHLLDVPKSVDPICFWAAGKLYALAEAKAPVCMIDTDFILWEKADFTAPITAAHTESVGNLVYPNPLSEYDTDFSAFYELPEDADALNTAICCFTDEAFKAQYLKAAFAFMEHSAPNGDTLRYMVCAEQRMLGMIAKKAGITPAVLLANGPFAPQKLATHTWGFKQQMREDSGARLRFCLRLARRIAVEDVKWANICQNIPQLRRYFHLIQEPIKADV